MKIADTKDIRTHNRLTILKTIHNNTPVSRADITTITNLNKGTVSTIVKELLDLNLVVETSIGDSTGGRKPIMLTPLYQNGYAIALDINVTHINIIVTYLNTEIISQHHFPLETNEFSHNFTLLSAFLRNIIDNLDDTPFGVVGIGVSVRGIIDLDNIIRYIHVLNWIDIDIKGLLEAEFDIPVYVDNDGNFSTMAESLHYPNIKDLAVLTIDDVVSSGALSNNELIRGFRGYANSFAHHIIDFDGKECICGQKGCFETLVSHRALLKEANESIPVPDIDTFILLAKDNNPVILNIIDKLVSGLAAGITNLIYILDCELIIINSKILTDMPHLLDDIRKLIILPITKHQSITISQIGDLAPLLGASKLACDSFYASVLMF